MHQTAKKYATITITIQKLTIIQLTIKTKLHPSKYEIYACLVAELLCQDKCRAPVFVHGVKVRLSGQPPLDNVCMC